MTTTSSCSTRDCSNGSTESGRPVGRRVVVFVGLVALTGVRRRRLVEQVLQRLVELGADTWGGQPRLGRKREVEQRLEQPTEARRAKKCDLVERTQRRVLAILLATCRCGIRCW